MTFEQRLREQLRDIPDFPRPGIVFKDITPVLAEPLIFAETVAVLAQRIAAAGPVDLIAGIESRGFIFGAAAARELGLGFVPIRKPGKLPWRIHRVEYALEYGTDALEIHQDAVAPGQRVAVVDDLLATGGTAGASMELLDRLEARIAGIFVVIELAFLNGRERIAPHPVDSLVSFV